MDKRWNYPPDKSNFTDIDGFPVMTRRKAKDRARLDDDIRRFLDRGGIIDRVAFGVSAIDWDSGEAVRQYMQQKI